MRDAERHKPGERTLYITVFDHKERTTRVYTRDDEVEAIYSTKSDALLVDVGHFLLEVELDAKFDSKGDPVCSNGDNMDSLREHHRSILEHIQDRLRAGDVTKTYAIENRWTMKVEDTISTLHRLREGNCEAVVKKGREEERAEESLLSDYFVHSSIERQRRSLDEKRAKWIARRMEMVAKETKERLLGTGVGYRVNMQAVEKMPATKSPKKVNEMLGTEQYFMECLLVMEVNEWEDRFWKKFKTFLDQVGKYRVEEKERLTREWSANCWSRLNPQMHAALKRIADFDDFKDKDTLLKQLGKEWASLISQLFEGVGKVIPLSGFGDEDEDEEMEKVYLRIDNEVEDIEFRLERGSDLGRFDQFWDDDTLFECRYSRSKWLFFCGYSPFEVYMHALKGNKSIIHMSLWGINSDFDVNQFLCDLPLVTSINPGSSVSIPAVPHDLLYIKSTNDDLITFAKKIKLDPSSTYIFLEAGDFYSPLGLCDINARVLISFVAPTSGKSLILRIKHSGEDDAPLKVTLGSTNIQLNPSSESSLTIDDITLYPIEVSSSSEFGHLSFVPEVRNVIYIRFIAPLAARHHYHYLNDIELLDEDGLEYMPHSASLSNV